MTAPLSERSRTVWAATFADQIAGLSPPAGRAAAPNRIRSERKPRDENPTTRPLFVSRRGHGPSGYCSIRRGNGCCGARVLRGVGRYLWCRETPGQRRARSRASLLAVTAPLSERSRTVWAATFADQIAGLSPPAGRAAAPNRIRSERKPRDENPTTRPLFVSRRGHGPSGYCSIRRGNGCCGARVLRGVGRYLWCCETPGQRRARSRASLLAVIAPLSERSRAVGAATVADQIPPDLPHRRAAATENRIRIGKETSR